MKYGGREVDATEGQFQIRTYRGGTAFHVSVGNDFGVAEALLKKHNAVRGIAEHEATLGIIPVKVEEPKTLAVLAEEYIADKLSPSQGLSRTSTRLYERTLRGFVVSCKRQYVTDVTKQDVTGYIDSLMNDYAQKSRAMRYSVIRGFLQNSGVNLKTLIDSAAHKRLSSKPESDRTPYTREQLEKLMAVSSPYYKTVFNLLLQTGCRFREGSHLLWSNVLWDSNQIYIPGEQKVTVHGKTKTFQSKSRKSRKVPMYAGLKAALMEWRGQHPSSVYVVGTRTDGPNGHWLEYGKQFWKDAGLNCGVCD
jgi:integrase